MWEWWVRLFHVHDFAEIARTHTPPLLFQKLSGLDPDTFLRTCHGTTTFVVRCQDPSCAEMRSHVALGKEGAP